MEQGDLVTIAALVGAALVVVTIIVTIYVRRNRLRREVVGGYEEKIARLGTSYETLRAGKDALESGDYEHALDCGFRVARRATPASYRIAASHALIGSAAAQLGRYRTAAEHIALATVEDARGDLVPSPSALLTKLAECQLALAEVPKAVQSSAYALAAAQGNTERARALQISGMAYLLAGETALARSNARFAADLDVDPVTAAMTDCLLGTVVAQDDPDRASVVLEAAAEVFKQAERWSDAARAVGYRADLFETIGNTTGALECWQEALRLLARRPNEHGNLAMLYARLAGAAATAGSHPDADRYLAAAETEFAVCELPTAEMLLAWARAQMASAKGDAAAASSAREEAVVQAEHLGLPYWRERIAAGDAV
jgi:tetratricopeptide (TPR) repeat protein